MKDSIQALLQPGVIPDSPFPILVENEGLNEKGFCVAFASCGMPVGKHLGMKKPSIKGLQFMVIVRAISFISKLTKLAFFLRSAPPVITACTYLSKLAKISGYASQSMFTNDLINQLKALGRR